MLECFLSIHNPPPKKICIWQSLTICILLFFLWVGGGGFPAMVINRCCLKLNTMPQTSLRLKPKANPSRLRLETLLERCLSLPSDTRGYYSCGELRMLFLKCGFYRARLLFLSIDLPSVFMGFKVFFLSLSLHFSPSI